MERRKENVVLNAIIYFIVVLCCECKMNHVIVNAMKISKMNHVIVNAMKISKMHGLSFCLLHSLIK